MDNLIISTVFVLVIFSIWFLPNVYSVVLTVLLAGLVTFVGYLTVTSFVILLILGLTGYQLLQANGKKNLLVQINIILILFWALWSESFQAGLISWTNYFQLQSVKYPIIIQVTFEKFFTALLLAAYILHPQITKQYLKKDIASTWEVVVLVYVFLLIPLVSALYFFADLRIGDENLVHLILTLIIICFTEEILYRLVLQSWCRQLVGYYSKSLARWLPIVLVSFVYALFHIELGIVVVIIYVFIGCIYGYVYQKSGKIEVAILVHFAVRLTLGIIMAFYAQNITHTVLLN